MRSRCNLAFVAYAVTSERKASPKGSTQHSVEFKVSFYRWENIPFHQSDTAKDSTNQSFVHHYESVIKKFIKISILKIHISTR